MWNILFGRKLQEYKIERNGEIVGTYNGEPGTSYNKKFVDFFEKLDIFVGDILINPLTNVRYHIQDIEYYEPEIIGLTGGIRDITFKVYYVPESVAAKNTTIFNIDRPIGSVIGSQQNVTISDNVFTELKSAINESELIDKPVLNELLQLLQDFNSGKAKLEKSGLKKFESVITKYAPIAISLGQLLTQILIH